MKDYYSNYSDDYYTRTVSVDSALFLSEFSSLLKPGDQVLDIGCGSGRDLLWMKKKGFKPLGLERSEGLAELAENHSGCDVIIADYEQFDFSDMQVDGILFSASLVHIPHNQIQTVISRVLKALKHNGYIYISLKEGDGTKKDNAGRVFYLWRDEELKTNFEELNLEVVYFSGSESVLNSGEVWLGYVLKYR